MSWLSRTAKGERDMILMTYAHDELMALGLDCKNRTAHLLCVGDIRRSKVRIRRTIRYREKGYREDPALWEFFNENIWRFGQ